jgi:hypothetical protein
VSWRHFFGACILSSGLLLKAGAPVEAVAMGIALIALITWRRLRSTS